MEFREGIISDFALLFDDKLREDDEQTKEQQFAKKWGWYSIIYNLAEEKFINMHKVTELELLEALTFLSYKIDYNYNNK